jgi:hypothetical protein
MIEVTSPFLANSKSDPFVEGDSSWKATPTDDKAYEAQNLFERLDLASFPTKTGGIASGPYGKSYVYQEDLSAFMADTKIAYEGEDGSKFFIHFSYKAISRKVRYEVVQDVKWIWDSPEAHPHPLDDYFGPKATANRILSFARGLVSKFRAMEGEDKEKLAAFMRKLIKAIDKGFREAGMALGPIPQDIGMMIHETYDLVMKGMALLNVEPSGAKVASQTRLTYEEEISYTSASMEISIMV